MLTPVEVEELYPLDNILVFKNGLMVSRRERYPIKRKYSPRKGIYEMSKKSKLRLSHIINNSEVKFVSMLTLTWGDFMPPVNGKELKRQLNIFLKKFRQHYKTPEYLWFLEFQRKGKPHIHLLTTIEPTPQDIKWFAPIWANITTKDAWLRLTEGKVQDYKVTKELDVSTLLDEYEKSIKFNSHPKVWEKFRKKDGAFRYVLKYATKSEQKLVPVEYANVGRFWGVSENVLPFPIGAVILGQEMSEAEVREMMSAHRTGQLPLIPRYIFQKNAVEFFSQHGLTMTEILAENKEKFVNNLYDISYNESIDTSVSNVVATRRNEENLSEEREVS